MSEAQIIPSLWLLAGGVAGGIMVFVVAIAVAEFSIRAPFWALRLAVGLIVVLLALLALSDPWVWGMIGGGR